MIHGKKSHKDKKVDEFIDVSFEEQCVNAYQYKRYTGFKNRHAYQKKAYACKVQTMIQLCNRNP